MKSLVHIAREIWGLFVEDATFTVALIVSLVLAALVWTRVLPAPWRGPVFFATLSLALVENVLRSARAARR